MSPKDPHFHNEAKELNLSCENEFYLHENEKAFPYQRLSTEPRFDTEVWGNSEIAYWLLFWCQVSSLSHRNYKCFCPKRCFFSPDRLQGRVEQAIKSSHRFVETLCCCFGIFPLQGNLAVKRCNILTMLLSPSKSATNKHLSILLLVHLFPKILTPKVLIDPLALQVMRNPHWIFSFSSQNLCLYIRNAHFNGINFKRKNKTNKKTLPWRNTRSSLFILSNWDNDFSHAKFVKFYIIIARCEDMYGRYCIQSPNDHFHPYYRLKIKFFIFCCLKLFAPWETTWHCFYPSSP